MTPELIERLKAAIRPGGAIVIEGLPADAQPGETKLPYWFWGWKTVTYEMVEMVPDWDWLRERRAVPVRRFFAIKQGGG